MIAPQPTLPRDFATSPCRIALISPKGPLYRHRKGIFKKSLRYQPLTLTTLAALVPDDFPAELTLIDEGIQDVPDDLEADLVGITVITGTAKRSYELAARFRARGITVVLGGPHVTLIPDDAQPHADAIVVGYAEDTWPQLLRDFAAGKLKPTYHQAPDLSLAGRPFPRRDLLPSKHFITSDVFEATRACIHNCDFLRGADRVGAQAVSETRGGGHCRHPFARCAAGDLHRSQSDLPPWVCEGVVHRADSIAA
jgi:hypothetical protein